MSFSYTSDSSSSSSQYAFSSMDYIKPCSRPASITSVQTTSTSSTQKSSDDSDSTFLSSDQTYSAYLKEQAAAKRPKNVNVYTTCGRHSNEWLFSGWFRK